MRIRHSSSDGRLAARCNASESNHEEGRDVAPRATPNARWSLFERWIGRKARHGAA